MGEVSGYSKGVWLVAVDCTAFEALKKEGGGVHSGSHAHVYIHLVVSFQ